MSAIVGIMKKAGTLVDDTSVKRVNESSNFFDADQVGNWQNENIFLGSYLLFNTPEALNERLPFEHPEYPAIITADVRLDNRKELIKLLDITDQQITDSRLILECYLKHGERCVDYLLGAFAFIIWDAPKQKLFAARDQFGIRPLHYYFNNGDLVIGTLVRSIVALQDVEQNLNPSFIKNILITSHLESDETFYKYIKVLLPAHTFIYESGTLRIKKYWEFDINKRTVFKEPNQYFEAFRELLFDSRRFHATDPHAVSMRLANPFRSPEKLLHLPQCLVRRHSR